MHIINMSGRSRMKNISIYIDIVFCLIVLPVMAMIYPVERWAQHFQWYVITVGVWLYLIYILNRVLIVPYLFRKGKYQIVGVCLIVLSIVLTYIISRVNLYTPKPNIHDVGVTRVLPIVQQYQQAVWSLFMIVEAFSFAVGLLIEANLQKSRRMAVETERDKANIELYKAQINPHFMFNTLNSIYGLFLTHNVRALESLEKFISMIRYIHTTSRSNYVQLSDEVDYVRQYVGLQELRLNEMTSIKLEIDIENSKLRIPPMIVMTFIENCFKHGTSPVERSTIIIHISEKDSTLTLTTQNRIFTNKNANGHTGLANCRKRLDILYPHNHMLRISEKQDFFHVKLTINVSA